MNSLDQLKQWIEKNKESVEKDYFKFLKFKSISADPLFKDEMEKCSDWLQQYITKHTNLRASAIETDGYPLVLAEPLHTKENAHTVLIYGHYDVQPVDPLELWHSDPFEPTIREGKIFARGAVDDKGQIFYAITALRALKELGKDLSVNVKFCIEGEEESASIGLSKALKHLRQKLKADSLLVVDFDQYDKDTPSLSLGARGILSFEVILTGSNSDLHSGIHGGMAYNPNKALVELLAKLWDENGKVTVPFFYEDVVETTAEERSRFSFRHNRSSYAQEFGVEAIGGEKGRDMADNNTFRPTLEINGICGGYTGSGIKTVIPAHATAKMTCRLVPNQDPEKLMKHICDFLKKEVVSGMQIQVISHGGEPAFRGSPDSILAKATSKASAEVMGRACKNILSAASIPIVAKMIQELEFDVVGMGYGLPTDNIHAPNEHFDWSRFENGFLTVARTLENL